MNALEELSQRAPFGDGRVSLGVAFDGWFLPKEMIVPLFDNIKKMGIKHLTTHNSPGHPGKRVIPNTFPFPFLCQLLPGRSFRPHPLLAV